MRQRIRVGGEAGFSMIEMLIAAALLLIIALGLIPLFARAIGDNTTGADFSQATNGNRSQMESTVQIPFGNDALVVISGQMQGVTIDSWAQGDNKKIGDEDEGWWSGTPTDKGLLLWERETRTYQYSMGALDKQSKDYTLTENERVPGGTDPAFFHLKEVEVILESQKGAIFGGGRRVAFRVLKPY